MSDQHESRHLEERRRAITPLEKSIRPSCLATPIALIVVMVLLRVRLPPLPYSLVVIGGIWLLCFIVAYLWYVQRQQRD